MSDSPEGVLLDEARRSITRQESTLDNLRSRSVAVFAASGVVAGFAAPKFVSHPASAVPAGIALGAFVVGAVVALAVTWSRWFVFSENLGGYADWVREHNDNPAASRVFTLGLAEHLEANRENNKPEMRHLTRLFHAQCSLLIVQVVLWALAYILA